jgi:hypothetical protein
MTSHVGDEIYKDKNNFKILGSRSSEGVDVGFIGCGFVGRYLQVHTVLQPRRQHWKNHFG